MAQCRATLATAVPDVNLPACQWARVASNVIGTTAQFLAPRCKGARAQVVCAIRPARLRICMCPALARRRAVGCFHTSGSPRLSASSQISVTLCRSARHGRALGRRRVWCVPRCPDVHTPPAAPSPRPTTPLHSPPCRKKRARMLGHQQRRCNPRLVQPPFSPIHRSCGDSSHSVLRAVTASPNTAHGSDFQTPALVCLI